MKCWFCFLSHIHNIDRAQFQARILIEWRKKNYYFVTIMNDKILNIHWINKQGKRIKRHRNKVYKYHNFKSIKITMGRGKKIRIENWKQKPNHAYIGKTTNSQYLLIIVRWVLKLSGLQSHFPTQTNRTETSINMYAHRPITMHTDNLVKLVNWSHEEATRNITARDKLQHWTRSLHWRFRFRWKNRIVSALLLFCCIRLARIDFVWLPWYFQSH